MITIESLPNVVAGDLVSVRATVPQGGQVAGAVCPHGGDSHTLSLNRRGRSLVVGQFRPDRPGRWWVSVRHEDVTAEACFWVSARRVQF